MKEGNLIVVQFNQLMIVLKNQEDYLMNSSFKNVKSQNHYKLEFTSK